MRFTRLKAWFDEMWPPDSCVVWPKSNDVEPQSREDRFPCLVGGIYCMAVEVFGDVWVPIYVGKAFDIRNRMQMHYGQDSTPESRACKMWFNFADRVGGMAMLLTRRIRCPARRAYDEVKAIMQLKPLMNSAEYTGFSNTYLKRLDEAMTQALNETYDGCLKMRTDLEGRGVVFPRPMLPRQEWIERHVNEPD